MSDIDEMWEGFLESASRHHIPEDVIQERAKEAEALRQDLDLVPVLGTELCDFLCDVWENGC